MCMCVRIKIRVGHMVRIKVMFIYSVVVVGHFAQCVCEFGSACADSAHTSS